MIAIAKRFSPWIGMFGVCSGADYLFGYKVAYDWKFTWGHPSAGGLRRYWRVTVEHVRRMVGIQDLKISQYPMHGGSIGPAMSWYFPWPGKVRISAVLNYPENEPIELGKKHLVISRSSDYGKFNILRGAEVAGWMIAGIIAIVSGLAMFYFRGTSWGTPQDYLTLILWGIGVDQGKNFFQALQASSSDVEIASAGFGACSEEFGAALK